jgi:glycerate 2-kinase
MSTKQRERLTQVFDAALARVNPYQMMRDHIRLDNEILTIRFEDTTHTVDLKNFHTIVVLGAGKATAPMARALEEILGERINRGAIVVKYGHGEPLRYIQVIEAAHPQPDEAGVQGAARLLELAGSADAHTLVITLLSGGGSALLPAPLHATVDGEPIQLSLRDKQDVTQALLRCGADITEINCIRKHLSAIKGGRLLQKIAPATAISFILSDVIGDDLSSIASGPTAADPTTYGDALAIIDRYAIRSHLPAAVLTVLEAGARGAITETPGATDPIFSGTTTLLIGTNRVALAAAREQAQALGYPCQTLTARISGEAREVAKFLAAIAMDARQSGLLAGAPCCILAGGEPVVTLQGDGKGGRNQEMALAFLAEIKRSPHLFENVCFLAASTDGNDGPTDAAGAFADLEMLDRAEQADLSPADYLAANDSYYFFTAINGLLKTGPTNTNVCDLQMILIDP